MTTTKETQRARPTLANTKKELIEAYQKLEEEILEKSLAELKPEKQIEERKDKEAVAAAEAILGSGVSEKMNQLKGEITNLLVQLGSNLETAIGEYKKLKEAIEAKRKELQEIYGIERSAFSLSALLEAQQQKRTEFEKEMAARRQEWEKEEKDRQAVLKEREEQDKKLRERQKEEYTYNFEREKQLAENKFKDDMAKLAKELALKEEASKKLIAEREEELKNRTAALVEREKRVNDLQSEVDSFPKRLEEAVQKSTAETAAKWKEHYEKNEALLRKEYEGERNVLRTRIEAMEKVTAEQNKQITTLSVQLEKAYGKVQDIAVKAVEGSAQAKALESIVQRRDAESK